MEQVAIKQSFQERERRFWHIRLASESSPASEDTESICSVQDKETDEARDTPDTETKSEYDSDNSSATDYFEVEYEVASISGDENPIGEDSSSSADDILVGAAIAAVMCDSSMSAWVTDAEDSDNSLDDVVGQTAEYGNCILCKSKNNNPQYTYCEKCFQRCWMCNMRKNFSGFPLCSACYKERKNRFPPRPRGKRKRKDPLTVTLSQDSGLGSSQEVSKLVLMDLETKVDMDIPSTSKTTRKRTTINESDDLFSDMDAQLSKRKKVNEDKKEEDKDKYNGQIGTSSKGASSTLIATKSETLNGHIAKGSSKGTTDEGNSYAERTKVRNLEGKANSENKNCVDKGQLGNNNRNVENNWYAKNRELEKCKETNEKGTLEVKYSDSKKDGDDKNVCKCLNGKTNSDDKSDNKSSSLPESKELCIVCNSAPKDSIFLHATKGHMCCCYRCAVKIFYKTKCCPVCRLKAQNVIKVFMC